MTSERVSTVDGEKQSTSMLTSPLTRHSNFREREFRGVPSPSESPSTAQEHGQTVSALSQWINSHGPVIKWYGDFSFSGSSLLFFERGARNFWTLPHSKQRVIYARNPDMSRTTMLLHGYTRVYIVYCGIAYKEKAIIHEQYLHHNRREMVVDTAAQPYYQLYIAAAYV